MGDYAHGLNVHFETQFPLILRGKISERTWETTIDTINSIFAEAEKVCFATILETILGCVTCYCSRLVAETIYQKKMTKLNEFLDRENQGTYNPAGLHILSPMERGLRTIEIWILSESSSDANPARSETSGVCIVYPESGLP
ncbi:hypothetical protein RB195_000353 [Necator americanus]|uniref:Ras modification protein ERF4 n=1 Tax=Necator americanus TaxID=51031 RepID=A0ABR1D997_NECAM